MFSGKYLLVTSRASDIELPKTFIFNVSFIAEDSGFPWAFCKGLFLLNSNLILILYFEQVFSINSSVQLQFVEHSNRRKMQSYSMRRKNSISAIIFIWLSFVANNIFVVWLGRFAPFAK